MGYDRAGISFRNSAMANKALVFDAGLIDHELCSISADEKNDILAHKSAIIFGIKENEKITCVGILHANPKHIFIRYIFGDFLRNANEIDNTITAIAKGLKCEFLAIDAGRKGVDWWLRVKHGFKKHSCGELIRNVQ